MCVKLTDARLFWLIVALRMSRNGRQMTGQLVRDIRRDVIEKIDVRSVSEGQTRDRFRVR